MPRGRAAGAQVRGHHARPRSPPLRGEDATEHPAPVRCSPSFRLDEPGRTTPPGGTWRVGLFSASRPARTRAGREAEAALRELFPFNPHPQSLGCNPLNPPRFGGLSALLPTCPSPLARGEGLNSSARPTPRHAAGARVGLPRSADRHHAPAAPGFVSKATPSHPQGEE